MGRVTALQPVKLQEDAPFVVELDALVKVPARRRFIALQEIGEPAPGVGKRGRRVCRVEANPFIEI